MYSRIALVALVALTGPGCGFRGGDRPDVAGAWRLEFQPQSNARATYLADCVWEQDRERLTGSCTSGFQSLVTMEGSARDSRVTFRFTSGLEHGAAMSFTGRVSDRADSVEGTWQATGWQGGDATGPFTAVRR